jgi:transcriptional regulator with XRE-family HTH domain
MLIPKITGTMIRAGRVFAHLSQDQLAARAGIHRDCLRTWEGSSDSVPRAQYRTLCRLIDALEAQCVQFSDDGVRLQRPAPLQVLYSDAVIERIFAVAHEGKDADIPKRRDWLGIARREV